MTFPAPQPGLVIRYSFLWSHEARAGAQEGSKDRPCAIVVAASLDETGDITVLVAPITHAPPEEDDSIPIPPPVAHSLDLDGERHWIRVDELNEFVWPGYDLRPIPGRPGAYAYGMLPRALYDALRSAIQARWKRVRPRVQKRD
jgi:hypothetical protein